MPTYDLSKALGTQLSELRGHPRSYTKKVAEARHAERSRRSAAAAAVAMKALRRTRHEEYRAYYSQALEQIHAEKGPLPGD